VKELAGCPQFEVKRILIDVQHEEGQGQHHVKIVMITDDVPMTRKDL
jgi:hypothetical protein